MYRIKAKRLKLHPFEIMLTGLPTIVTVEECSALSCHSIGCCGTKGQGRSKLKTGPLPCLDDLVPDDCRMSLSGTSLRSPTNASHAVTTREHSAHRKRPIAAFGCCDRLVRYPFMPVASGNYFQELPGKAGIPAQDVYGTANQVRVKAGA